MYISQNQKPYYAINKFLLVLAAKPMRSFQNEWNSVNSLEKLLLLFSGLLRLSSSLCTFRQAFYFPSSVVWDVKMGYLYNPLHIYIILQVSTAFTQAHWKNLIPQLFTRKTWKVYTVENRHENDKLMTILYYILYKK